MTAGMVKFKKQCATSTVLRLRILLFCGFAVRALCCLPFRLFTSSAMAVRHAISVRSIATSLLISSER